MIKGDPVCGKVDSEIFKAHFFYFEKQEDGERQLKKTISAQPNGKLTGWPAGFFDEWEANLQQLLF